jgi:hypothetical protein
MGIAFENGSAGVNATNGHGGAISNGASLTIINCNFTGNTKINFAGAAVGNLGVLTVSNCNFTGNLAVGGVGGAIYNLNTATINDSLLVNNVSGETSGFGGGAIYNGGTLTLNRCTLAGNSVINYAGGGAVFNDQQAILSINQCTLSGNAADGYISGENSDGSKITAGGDGGAIYIYQSHVTVNQSTFFGNHADTSYDGGGAIMNDNGFFSINQSTIVGNHANNTGHSTVNYQNGGGGLWAISTGIFSILTNSIVAGNSATNPTGTSFGSDILASKNGTDFVFGGANVVQDFVGLYAGPAPIIHAPLLAPFGNYGGPTQTMPPMPGSPAIDAGGTTTFITDQRGYPRPAGLGSDIGAVEGIYNTNVPGKIKTIIKLGNGSIQIGFTNVTDAVFPVLATTNLSQSVSNWTTIGFATESPVGSGQFPFTDTQATNYPQRFYRIRSP